MWTATDTSNNTPTVIGITSDSVLGSTVSWTPANFPGTYTVTMTTDVGACVDGTAPTGTFGTTMVTVTFKNIT